MEPTHLTVNGADLASQTRGAGSPIVFVHGFTLDHRMWSAQVVHFAQNYLTLAYDLRGFGRSSDPIEGTPYCHADDLAALMNHLGIGPATIVGLSYGGWVATEFTLIYPELVKSLVLVDATIRHFPYGGRWQGVLDQIGELARAGRMNDGKRLWLDDVAFTCPGRSEEQSQILEEMVADYRGWHWFNPDTHTEMLPWARDRLNEITIPALVITGEHDIQEFQDIAALYANRLPNAQRVTLPGAAHMANMDDPTAFNRIVAKFIAENRMA